MSFYFGPRNNALRRVQFAAAASFFDQLLPRDAAQSEGQNFFDQRVDLTRTPPRNLADHFLDSAQDAKGGDARIAGADQVHLHSQVQGTLDGVSDALVEFQDPQIEITVETHRVVEQDVSQLALRQHEIHHALEVV